MSDNMSDNMIDFVCGQLDELKQQIREKHQQYSTEDALANFRVGAMLSGKQADCPAMYEEAKAYARKHIAFVYTHDIHGDKITESLKDIAVYSLIGLYMAELAKEEDEETYSLGSCVDSALIAAANRSIKVLDGLQREIDSVITAQKNKEDAEE